MRLIIYSVKTQRYLIRIFLHHLLLCNLKRIYLCQVEINKRNPTFLVIWQQQTQIKQKKPKLRKVVCFLNLVLKAKEVYLERFHKEIICLLPFYITMRLLIYLIRQLTTYLCSKLVSPHFSVVLSSASNKQKQLRMLTKKIWIKKMMIMSQYKKKTKLIRAYLWANTTT